MIATVCATFCAALGSWVALFPDTIELIFGIKYSFVQTWGVSRWHFEVLTLGTVGVIIVLTFAGLALGRAERRREGIEDAPVAEVGVGSTLGTM